MYSLHKVFLRMFKPDWSLGLHGVHSYKERSRNEGTCAIKTLPCLVDRLLLKIRTIVTTFDNPSWSNYLFPSQSGRGDTNTMGDESKQHFVQCCLCGMGRKMLSFGSQKSGFQSKSTNYQLNNSFTYL